MRYFVMVRSSAIIAIVAGSLMARRSAAQGDQVRIDTGRPGYTAADVQFMQSMIAHHAQAVTMAALVPSRTTGSAIGLLAQRIDVSQKDEIAMMRRWLQARHQEIPSPTDAPMLMPGMLTPEEMASLAQASGTEFERMFLQGMIKHHEGALTMVAELFATNGAGQEPQLFGFASDVDADQRAEIRRMRTMLAALHAGPP
jgi:uncharacterized protein (DUF305 family)